MGTRSVRLDDEAEAALAEITRRTGMSISQVIKQGLLEFRDASRAGHGKSPADFFADFDLGAGGYSIAPGRQARSAVREKLQRQKSRR